MTVDCVHNCVAIPPPTIVYLTYWVFVPSAALRWCMHTGKTNTYTGQEWHRHRQSCSVITPSTRLFKSVVRLLHFWNIISCIDHTSTSENCRESQIQTFSVDSNRRTDGVDMDVYGGCPVPHLQAVFPVAFAAAINGRVEQSNAVH